MKKPILSIRLAVLAAVAALTVSLVPQASAQDLSPTERRAPALRANPSKTPPPGDIAASIDVFFKNLQQGDSVKAFDGLLTNTRLAERKEQLNMMINRTDQAMGMFGKVISWELYDNQQVGTSLMVLTYLSNSSVQPLRWRFVYYKPEKMWTIINMDCDDQMMEWVKH